MSTWIHKLKSQAYKSESQETQLGHVWVRHHSLYQARHVSKLSEEVNGPVWGSGGRAEKHDQLMKKSAGKSNNNRGLIVASISPRLNQIGHIHRHFFNGGPVVLLNILENSCVISSHKVDSNSLSAKATTSANPVKE